MNAQIFNNWNNVVTDNDLVIHLGDIAANVQDDKDSLKWVIQNLKGKKILIKGNHDYIGNDFYYECGVQKIYDYLEMNDYFLCHYPCFRDSKYLTKPEADFIDIFNKSKCTKIIHGHTHNNISSNKNFKWSDGIPRLNASVEVINYAPLGVNFK